MGRLVKLIGLAIGIASEAIAASRSSSSARASNSANSTDGARNYKYVDLPEERAQELIAKGQAVPLDVKDAKEAKDAKNKDYDSYSDDTVVEDEVEWELDDALKENPSADESRIGKEPQYTVDEFVKSLSMAHPLLPIAPPVRRLPCPVIIPQRRPHSKSRGFIRAYAPILSECGIDQDRFLYFLKMFHRESKASSIFTVINIAAFAVGFVPTLSAQIASLLLQKAVGVASELQSRQRTNFFLDEVNNKVFQPRGLFCVIMTYKPDQKASHETVDTSELIFKSLNPSDSKIREGLKTIRGSSGKTYGEFEMPEAASLVFPALDEAAAGLEQDPKKQNAFKKSQKLMADYFDRRAQATYTQYNPNSSLAVNPGQEFASRYSDPTHPANSGSLISLLTGGKINTREAKDRRRAQRAEWGGRPLKKKERGLKRILKENVLYLMIVNMPTEEEMEIAKTKLTSLKASKDI